MKKSQKPDIEKSWLVQGAYFDEYDIPLISTAYELPSSLLPFSHRKETKDFSNWIHFYEPDEKYICFWNNPKTYVKSLRHFNGVISPDFSICPDYPLPLQYQNKYRNHALAYWLTTQGIPVIPNVRWANKCNYDFCFSGIEKNSVVAVGTHGQMQSIDNRKLFLDGLPVMVSKLRPHTIIVYGKIYEDIWGEYRKLGMRIIPFPSQKEIYHNQRKVVV